MHDAVTNQSPTTSENTGVYLDPLLTRVKVRLSTLPTGDGDTIGTREQVTAQWQVEIYYATAYTTPIGR